ncbi:MAG TPA: hypothetical protein IAA64_11415 [Candidatus Ornithocaccomicrobium faecavium]|uniref:Lipoprotein n=1 Tax=Candidatus Ornithocaccomicrobium faecavium TaxID=2840890 RepID=A0A9D1TDU7_9FIRM|nr:hypothetical protein [Candidatus Ornithocaccomicrobium faecavium]
MKKILAISLAAALLLLAGCSGAAPGEEGATALKFTDAVSLETLTALDDKTVSIVGYMATLSPLSGKFLYLMNMPYQSCPFCAPNTAQLANTMAVYAPEGQTFGYTDQAIRVTGTLRIEDYTDEYGYVYNYRIADASYEIVDLAALSEDYALWQSIASDGVVAEINSMFDYLHFLCQWTEYQSGYTDDDGSEVVYFLYPGDVEMYLQDTGPYGYAQEAGEDYFPGLIERIRAISANDLEDLVTIVESAQQVAATALSELRAGNYTYDSAADKYALQKNEELYNAWYDAYSQFALWLAKWEI